jgi:hypothetical protein
MHGGFSQFCLLLSTLQVGILLPPWGCHFLIASCPMLQKGEITTVFWVRWGVWQRGNFDEPLMTHELLAVWLSG